MWQARQARDAEVRTALRRIARDELEHAELAWKVHGFFVQRLSGAERARVESALREEALAIVGGRAAAVSRAVMEVSGVPSPEQTARLARAWAGNVVATLRRRERASSTSQFSTATAAPASHAHPAPELART
jgi:hypothetical protein